MEDNGYGMEPDLLKGMRFLCAEDNDLNAEILEANGLEATRAIRSGDNALGKTIPIIAMTANAFTDDIQLCLEAGMDAHVAKPLNL